MTGYLIEQGSQMLCENCDAHCLKNRCPAAEQNPHLTMGETSKKLGELWKEISSEEKAKYEVSCSSQDIVPGLELRTHVCNTFPCSPDESALCAGNGREGQGQGCSRAC